MTVDLASFKPLFLKTSTDYERQMENSLETLISDPKDAHAIESLYLAAHSVKSQSHIMGYAHLSTVCKELEQVYYQIKFENKTLTPQTLTLTQETIDYIRTTLDTIKTGGADTPADHLCEALRKLSEKL